MKAVIAEAFSKSLFIIYRKGAEVVASEYRQISLTCLNIGSPSHYRLSDFCTTWQSVFISALFGRGAGDTRRWPRGRLVAAAAGSNPVTPIMDRFRAHRAARGRAQKVVRVTGDGN